MNFLAHIYLSGNSKEIIIGNFIGDFVKGKAWKDFDESIQKGILLHREIDRYTDSHEVVAKTKERLRPKYRHYAPVIGDVFYDHFLASLWVDYHSVPLLDFTKTFYKLTEAYKKVIPERANRMLIYMQRDNWLYHYRNIEGIDQALTGMSQRTPYKSKMEYAAHELRIDYGAYKADFVKFFPDLIRHSKLFLSTL